MARRKSGGAAGVNLDSLMDTLTNVVGILIIILILVQINVSQALKKIVSELPPVSIEELQEIKEEAKKQEIEHEKLKQSISRIVAQEAKDKTELAKLEPQLKVAETTAAQTKTPLLDLDSLRKQIEDRKKQLDVQKKAVDTALAEQQRLKAVLDTTPVVAPPAAKIVRIPNSRPLPEKAKLERYLVSGGQLFYLDIDAAMKLVLADFQQAKSRLEKERTKDAKGATKIIYDQEKVAKHFEQRRLSLRNLDIKIVVSKTSTRAVLQLHPRAGQGEPLAAAMQITSRFQNDLRRYKGTASVVWFHVARDSFEHYLRAREICDQQGVGAGWEVASTPLYAEGITEFDVNRLAEPPPAPVPAPGVPVIAAPKKKLD
ncbi:MAG: hypothetical protein ABMA13_10735 [Chthoniobacteraceae bacterium]